MPVLADQRFHRLSPGGVGYRGSEKSRLSLFCQAMNVWGAASLGKIKERENLTLLYGDGFFVSIGFGNNDFVLDKFPGRATDKSKKRG
jgi:hypothetical protein